MEQTNDSSNKENIKVEPPKVETVEREEKAERKLSKSQSTVANTTTKETFDRSYEEAIHLRKQESFANYSDWEKKRKELVERNKVITNNIITKTEKKLEWIDSCLEQVIKFFKDRITQEEVYIKVTTQGLPQLGKIFSIPNNPEVFANFGKAMQEVDEYHKKTCQNSQAMVKFLQSIILEGILIASEKEYKKKLDALREPVVDAKKTLIAATQKNVKKSVSYAKQYEEIMKKSVKATKEKDLCKKEMEVTISGQKELKALRDFSHQALGYLNEVIKLAVIRLNLLQKALTQYFQKCSEIYGKTAANPDLLATIFAGFKSSDDIQDYFSVKRMFTPEELKPFTEANPGKDITYSEIYSELVEKCSSKPPEHRPLVLKEWKASKEVGIIKSWKPVNLVITADGNILIIEKNALSEPDNIEYVLKLQQIKIQKNEDRKDRSILDVVEIVPGIILNSKTKLTLKFDTEDMAEEFLHYIYNYFNTSVINGGKN